MDHSTARRRRSSVPSQHYLSAPLAADASEVRFRDEMGINDTVGAGTENYPGSIFSHRPNTHTHHPNDGVNPNLLNANSLDIKWRPGDVKRDTHTNAITTRDLAGTSSASDGPASLFAMKIEDPVVQIGASITMDIPAKKKVRKKWTIEETKMLVDGCNKVIVDASYISAVYYQ